MTNKSKIMVLAISLGLMAGCNNKSETTSKDTQEIEVTQSELEEKQSENVSKDENDMNDSNKEKDTEIESTEESKEELTDNFDNDLEKISDDLVTKYIEDNIFPSAQVLVAKDGDILVKKAYGDAQLYNGEDFESIDKPEATRLDNPIKATNNTLYDLASVTKIVATTQAIMKLDYEGKLDVNDKVSKYIDGYEVNGKEDITIADLLTHTSGIPQWEPTFFYIDNNRDELLDYNKNLGIMFDDGEVHYSDFGFMTLGYVVESITGQSLDEYVENNIYKPLGMNHTFYKPLDKGVNKEEIAATSWGNPFEYRMVDEEDYPDFGYDTTEHSEKFNQFDRWRNHVLIGEVNDGNTGMASDGIAGHAGIYSNTSDLAILCQLMLNGGTYDDVTLYDQSTIDKFATNHTGESNRGYGFELDMKYMGEEASDKTYGHNGFTGTHISIDPENNTFIIFLTNKQNLGLDEEGSYKGIFDAVGEFATETYKYIENSK